MSESYKNKIIETIADYPKDKFFSSSDITIQFPEISRQYISKIITELCTQGVLVKTGKGPATRYYNQSGVIDIPMIFPIEVDTSEDDIYKQVIRKKIPANTVADIVMDKLKYIFTEMVNNAIDHSGSDSVSIALVERGNNITCSITDTGIGIFQNVMAQLHLENHFQALEKILEGKTTTDTKRHSGEGIFFSSKIAQQFEIISSEIHLIIDNERNDYTLTKCNHVQGTSIIIILDKENTQLIEHVFKQYTNDDSQFTKTKIVVELYQHGVSFVSRSEAKRLLSDLAKKYEHIVFDYQDVKSVGQGFVDQVYRVFAASHPDIKIESIHMNESVTFMVRRSLG